jgi:dTDP-4-dehydrorhamnose 3,5-epimerase
MLNFAPSPENKIAEFIYQMPLPGMWYIEHKTFPDDRGFYAELGRIPELEAAIGKPFPVKQLNLSYSKKYVARGFHAENWNKLLTVTRGVVFAAWADLRTDSPTFGQTVCMEVGKDNGTPWGSVFVPSGVANSFCTVTETADYLYAVDQLYADRDKSNDIAISLFDPDLKVTWPFPLEQLQISERDKTAITLRERSPDKF